METHKIGDETDDTNLYDIGNEAIWTLSSAKLGNGIEQLRDGNISSFWQSDGPQPHLITLQFPYKVNVKLITFYTDFKLDESYTPSKISLRSGTSIYDLSEIYTCDLDEPIGWVTLLLPINEYISGNNEYHRNSIYQLAILSSHQSGRDTHIRQMKILAPIKQSEKDQLFTSIEFQSKIFIR